MKYQALNGWTKKTIWLAIAKGNLGAPSFAKKYAFLDKSSGIGRCAYRGDGGNKCAVGVFIPDEVYSEDCELNTVEYLLKQYRGLKSYMPLNTTALMRLQAIHDNCDPDTDPRIKLLVWVEDHVV